MKVNITRNISRGVFSTNIKFAEYGTTSLTAEQEKEIVEDFNLVLAYKDITFQGNYQVNSNEVVSGGSETVKIELNNLEFPIGEKFEVTYSIATKNILDSEKGTSLNTLEYVAQAKCILFEDKIKAQLKALLDAAREKKNTFEKAIEVNV